MTRGPAGMRRALLGMALAGLLAGGAAALLHLPGAAAVAWGLATLIVAAPLCLDVARSLARSSLGVDVIALLAMIGALAVGETLAAAVVALMVAGGSALEEHASARARRDLSALLARSPTTAHRYQEGRIVQVAVADLRPADRILVKQGDTVPVDGAVASDIAVLDDSALTGESIPVERAAGDTLFSGAVNAGGPFEMIATATADRSTYAAMARLAREAEAREAPFARMADRYAGFFLPATLLAAALAWGVSGDPRRAVAVLVVATPCPMILAVPIAMVCGMSRGARRGIMVKGGQALEGLARARVLLMDKTGTITVGAAQVADVIAFGGRDPDEIVRLAASLDQVSSHAFAPAIVREARARRLALSMPDAVTETPGGGIRGAVAGRCVAVGKGTFVSEGGPSSPESDTVRRHTASDGSASAFVALDGQLAGALILHDPIRPDAADTVRALRNVGIRRVVLVTGDHPLVADAVGAAVGADVVLSERSAVEKVEMVRSERVHGPTIMVGDGVNDAAALADVGVALGARGSSAASEAADVVILVDHLDRVAESLDIAKRSMHIARQSLIAGMGMSLVAMAAAGAGLLPPVAGALLQEGIDVAVILNALRALSPGRAGAERYGLGGKQMKQPPHVL